MSSTETNTKGKVRKQKAKMYSSDNNTIILDIHPMNAFLANETLQYIQCCEIYEILQAFSLDPKDFHFCLQPTVNDGTVIFLIKSIYNDKFPLLRMESSIYMVYYERYKRMRKYMSDYDRPMYWVPGKIEVFDIRPVDDYWMKFDFDS